MSKIIDAKNLSNEEIAEILNVIQIELDSREVEKQFDVFDPDEGEIYHFFSLGSGGVVSYPNDMGEFDKNISLNWNPRRTREAAEKDGELWKLTKNIERRIAELNREHGWTCDWIAETQEKYCFYLNNEIGSVSKARISKGQANPTRHYMHKETAKKILTEFTEAELRAFVSQEWVK